MFLTSIGDCAFFEVFLVEPLHGSCSKSSAPSVWVRPICATDHSHDLCEKATSRKTYGCYVRFHDASCECETSTKNYCPHSR